jgi:hypothetical protein
MVETSILANGRRQKVGCFIALQLAGMSTDAVGAKPCIALGTQEVFIKNDQVYCFLLSPPAR